MLSAGTTDHVNNDVSFRNRRFLLAVVFSIISKVVSFGVQVMAIPIAISYCGMSTYVLYVQTVAVSLGPCVLLLRLGPRFVGIISILHSNGDSGQLTMTTRKGLYYTIIACGVAGSVTVAVLFSPKFQFFSQQPEVKLAFIILGCSSLVGGLFQSIEAIQSGMHETHLISASYTISNVLSILLIVTAIPVFANLISLVIVLHVVPLISRTIFAISFLFRHRENLFTLSGVNRTDHSILLDAVNYTFMSGFCAYLGFQAPFLALTSTSMEVGVSQILTLAFQFSLQALGLLGIVFVPMVPVMANAWNSGDLMLLASYRRNILFIIFGSVFVGMAVGTIAGLWSLSFLNISRFQLISAVVSAGAFLGILGLEQFLTTYLLTIASGTVALRVYVITCLRSILVFCTALTAIVFGLHLYAMSLMAVVIAITSCLPMHLILKHIQCAVAETFDSTRSCRV